MTQITEVVLLTEADTQQLYAGLVASDPADQPRQYAPLTLGLRSSESQLVGGLLAATVWTWLSIDVLWVDPTVRGRGFGRQLMVRAETIALGRGCTDARLDTFDFQARAFYERLGYRVYAELPGFPAEHIQFHLRKRLAPASCRYRRGCYAERRLIGGRRPCAV
jgi:ribosomal protein S18 acetylase RimI-like enzyme